MVITRRATLRALSVGAGALVAAACVPAPGPAAQPTPATNQPRAGGTVHFAQSPDVQSVDPSITASQNRASTPLAYDTLTRYDANLKPQPMLAESWDTSDYKTIKLSLRKNVQFHNGRELTADDIKYNLLRVRDPKVGASQQAAQSAWFTDIQTPDRYTVILKSDKARLGLFDFFEFFRIGDQATLEGTEAKTKAVGTGPFVWTEWTQGQQIRLTRNPNYWQPGKPYLNEYVVHIIPDAQALVTQLEAGVIDMAAPSLRDADRLDKSGKFNVPILDLGGQTVFNVNTTLGPTSNKQFRQALAYSVDRRRYVDLATFGKARPYSLPWASNSPAYEAPKENFYAFNLDKAAALVKDSGIQNPEIDIQYQATGDATLPQIVQADLQQIGVKVNLKPLELGAWLAAAMNLTYNGLSLNGNGYSNLGLPSSMFELGAGLSPAKNFAGFTNPEYSQLIEDIGTEPDEGKRKALLSRLNDYFLDNVFMIEVASSPGAVVMAPKVNGFSTAVSGSYRIEEVWLSA